MFQVIRRHLHTYLPGVSVCLYLHVMLGEIKMSFWCLLMNGIILAPDVC